MHAGMGYGTVVPMDIGYARVSTTDQSLDMQIDALRKAGCERIYTETGRGARDDRPELKARAASDVNVYTFIHSLTVVPSAACREARNPIVGCASSRVRGIEKRDSAPSRKRGTSWANGRERSSQKPLTSARSMLRYGCS